MKLGHHHMASLDLLIPQKQEIQQNWNFVDQHCAKNCLIHAQSFKISTRNKQSGSSSVKYIHTYKMHYVATLGQFEQSDLN